SPSPLVPSPQSLVPSDVRPLTAPVPPNAVLAIALRGVQRLIRAFEQLTDGRARRGDRQSDADGHARRRQDAIRRPVRLDALTDALGDPQRVFTRAPRHDDDELLAPEPRAHVEDADRAPQDVAHIAQNRVAGEVAERIV